MCTLSPSPRNRGYFLNNSILIPDTDIILSAGPSGTETYARGHLLKQVRTELRKRHVAVAPFGRIRICESAEAERLARIGDQAEQPPANPAQRLSATDWGLVIATACLAGVRADSQDSPYAKAAILATGENAIVSVAATTYQLQAQVVVSSADANRFWYFISNSEGTANFQAARNSNSIPLRIP